MPHPLSRPARRAAILSAALVIFAGAVAQAADAGKQWVFVGTYTSAKNGSKGIYRYDFDPATGQLTPAGLAAEAVNPSFLTIHPTGKYLFAVGEFDGPQGKATGVSSFHIDSKTGLLTLIGGRPSGGDAPCHVAIDQTGKDVIVANYGSGHQAVLEVKPNGELMGPVHVVRPEGHGPDRKRQEGPHAHCAVFDAANRHVAVADLGTDTVWVYAFSPAAGMLGPGSTTYRTAPGAGPRHLDFHPDGKRAYLINELNSTLSALDYDPDKGVLTERQTVSTLPAGWKGNSTCAEVFVHPSGKFVYGSNRGHDSIAAFAIAPDGKLRLVGHQGEGVKTPRNFAIDPSGKWMIVANQDGNSLVVFKIDRQTGALISTGVRADVGGPVCVKFLAAPKTD
jgi:6-phosphogluconolactonase